MDGVGLKKKRKARVQNLLRSLSRHHTKRGSDQSQYVNLLKVSGNGHSPLINTDQREPWPAHHQKWDLGRDLGTDMNIYI